MSYIFGGNTGLSYGQAQQRRPRRQQTQPESPYAAVLDALDDWGEPEETAEPTDLGSLLKKLFKGEETPPVSPAGEGNSPALAQETARAQTGTNIGTADLGDFFVSPKTRADFAPSADALNISMDFNAAPSGTARGTEVIIPDNASPEMRAAAERYNQMVAQFAADNGIADYPVRGVRTRSENGRGVRNTMHVEPFFNTDLEMQKAIQANPAAFAALYREAFSGIPNARLIAPHGIGKDRGAASSIFTDETTFGELMAKALLGG